MFAQICLTSVRALLPTNRVCETLIGWPAYACLSWQPPPGDVRQTEREKTGIWRKRLGSKMQCHRRRGVRGRNGNTGLHENLTIQRRVLKTLNEPQDSPLPRTRTHSQSLWQIVAVWLVASALFLGLWMNQVRVSGSSSFSCLNYWCGISSIFFIGHPWGNVMVCVTVVLLCYKAWFTEALTWFVILIGRFSRNPTAMFTILAQGSGARIQLHHCFVPLPHI